MKPLTLFGLIVCVLGILSSIEWMMSYNFIFASILIIMFLFSLFFLWKFDKDDYTDKNIC